MQCAVYSSQGPQASQQASKQSCESGLYLSSHAMLCRNCSNKSLLSAVKAIGVQSRTAASESDASFSFQPSSSPGWICFVFPENHHNPQHRYRTTLISFAWCCEPHVYQEVKFYRTSTAAGIDVGARDSRASGNAGHARHNKHTDYLRDSSPSPYPGHLGRCLTHVSQIPSARGCLCARCSRPAGPLPCSVSVPSPRGSCCESPSYKL